MKLKSVSLHIFIFVLPGFLYAKNGLSVEKPNMDDSKAVAEEIAIVRPYKPVLMDATKPRTDPKLTDDKPFKPNLIYVVPEHKLELDNHIDQLPVKRFTFNKNDTLKQGYATGGFGNFRTREGELYLDAGKNKAFQLGLYAKHLSQQGPIARQIYSDQQAKIFAKNIQSNYSMRGAIAYNRNFEPFYGIGMKGINTNPKNQCYQLYSAEGELVKNYAEKQNSDYNLQINTYSLRDRYEKSENSLALSLLLEKNRDQWHWGLGSSVSITMVSDSLYHLANHIGHFCPYIKWQASTYQINIGLNMAFEFGSLVRKDLFPIMYMQIVAIPSYMGIFMGYTGDLIKTSLNTWRQENPYLGKFYALNSIEKSHAHVGFGGNIRGDLNYKLTAHYKIIHNMPLLINAPINPNQFVLIYDSGDSKILSFVAEMDYQLNDLFSWSSRAVISNYKMGTEAYAWYKPNAEVFSSLRFTIHKNFRLAANATLNGGSKAKLPKLGGWDVLLMKGFANLGGSLTYSIAKKLDIYIQADNILNNNYQQYLYYPHLGLNIKGGLSYSFL